MWGLLLTSAFFNDHVIKLLQDDIVILIKKENWFDRPKFGWDTACLVINFNPFLSLQQGHERRAIGELFPLCWGTFTFALKGAEAQRWDDLRKTKVIEADVHANFSAGINLVLTLSWSKIGVFPWCLLCLSNRELWYGLVHLQQLSCFFSVLYFFFLDHRTWRHQQELGGKKRHKQILHRHDFHDRFLWWRRLSWSFEYHS